MRHLIHALIIIFGIFIGAVLGFVGPLLFCLAYDAMTNPTPGSGMMTVGWIFCFFTIPVFAIIGGVISTKIANKKFKPE